MDFPYIDQIAASLRSCSLGEHRPTPSPPPAPDIPDVSAGRITVELNSEMPLPFCWEQRLDIQTGEIHYINWETGEKTTADPRSAATANSTYSSGYYYTDEDEASGAGSGKEGYDEEEDYDNGSGDTADPDEDEASGTGSGIDARDEEEDDDSTAGSAGTSSTETLVAAGCSACFMYLMVPKGTPACPKCGAALIHLGNCL